MVEKSLKLFIYNWVYLIPSVLRATKIINKLKPDLIHLNSTCLFAFSIAARLSRVNPRVICHVREPLRKGLWGAPLRFFCKKNVDGFIGISQFDLGSLNISNSNSNQRIKTKLIYNFVNIDEYSPGISKNTLRKKLNIKAGEIVFLYMARFAKSNGWEFLIERAKEMVIEHPNFHFVLLGSSAKQAEEIAAPGNVHIEQFTNEVIDILWDADVFVCPFIEPHFARGVIEASAVGLPILASQIGGVDELVKDGVTGFLYNNPKQFNNYAIQLGNNIELRAQLGKNGRLFAEECFEQTKNLKETYEFYNEILTDK
ncbi:glycosyltransferase family 4 protein [Mucilaginibacter xinganensis]|uniref:glycosyltransferase family 4 protein n=1 Tax=Mucilaginibacter xinganensis TaxID=1234841 RepID=UPI0012FD24AE|nr:glycosyltransferase family 4 protein [Mucilaginibacter xinganensis]